MEFLKSLHPIVVHFPLVMFVLYFLFELINLKYSNNFKIATHFVLLLGITFGVLAVLSGNQAAEYFSRTSQVKSETILMAIKDHEYYASLLLWYYIGIAIFRTYLIVNKKLNLKFQIILIILGSVGIWITYLTGFHGGNLVYEFGVGTSLLK